jgi:TonB family protein
VILKLTVLLILACLADAALRRATAALRHLMWCLTLVSALALPLAGWYAPRIAGSAFVIRGSAAIGSLMASPAAKFNWVIPIYLAGVAVLLIRLALDVLAANRIVRESQATSLPRVRVSDRAIVPFAWGSIVVPAAFDRSPAVIAHEAAHIERGDVWTSLMARVACAVYWFHPLVWWAAARMRLEADRACDDAVLRSGFGDVGYADELVGIARSFAPSILAPGAVKKSQLELRVRHILAGGVDRRKLGFAAVVVAALTCIAVFSPLAALSQQFSQPAKGKLKIYKMSDGMTPPRVLYKLEPQYTEDARAAKISGPVILMLVVGSDGVARDIQVKQSLDPGLDQSAINAVQRWKFQPGVKDGQAVDVMATIEVNFRLL